MNAQRKKPELMSPAGGWPQLRTAIEAGADAVYFGLNHFSARAKVGFSLDELPDVMIALHERGVKGFVTFNTLIFDHEIDQARRVVEVLQSSRADAIIVQDVGMARDVSVLLPELEIHGSTQMSITSAQGAQFARQIGCRRVVLGRELSLADIRRIREELDESQCDVELETFVHGALCVSYSGQCFSSEAWGGRSANRGQCAQACRLSYDLIVDGLRRELDELRYLLSPGDLYALEQIPELVDIGVACMKIEGRYKDANYVAATTRAYREAIDRAWDKQPHQISDEQFADIEQSYSRGLGAFFISGTNHQRVVASRAPRHRGVRVATVTHVGRDWVDVELISRDAVSIAPGDGLVFDAADRRSPDEAEEGGFVFETTDEAGHLRLRFGRDSLDYSRIAPGDWVWRTHDPKLAGKLSYLTKAGSPVYTRPLRHVVTARLGQPLKIAASIEDGITAEYLGDLKCAPARSRPFDESTAIEQLGRLGGTPFHLESLEFDCKEELFVPVSELNAARRQLVEDLLQQRRERGGESISSGQQSLAENFAKLPAKNAAQPQCDSTDPQLHLLVRNAEQLEAAITCGPASITLDYLDLYGLRPAVESVQAENIVCRVASPRILKPAEQNVVRFLLSLGCDILVRSSGLLHDLLRIDSDDRPKLIGDFSLNVANQLSLEFYRNLGLQRITPSHDLNASQISSLADSCGAELLEVIAFQHLPVFHTEHCVFCRFLSEGTDSSNCGHPCESHLVSLRDANGLEHPVLADVGCRNTVFGAQPQSAAKHLKAWRARRIRHFRLEFVHENGEQVQRIAQAFHDFFQHQLDAGALRRALQECGIEKTTQGSLYVPDDFRRLYQLS